MDTKTCNKCGELKSLDEFYFNKKYNSHAGRCKECSKAASKDWARKNKDRLKAWKEANKDKAKENSRRYYEK